MAPKGSKYTFVQHAQDLVEIYHSIFSYIRCSNCEGLKEAKIVDLNTGEELELNGICDWEFEEFVTILKESNFR